jgi:hypothetical protein
MLLIPTTSKAGVDADGPGGLGQRLLDQTDTGSFRLVYFVDRRERESYIQVTNTTTRALNIHVQMFDVVGGGLTECEECNFNDMLTPEDTHVYDSSAFVTNMGAVSQCNLEDNHYGFVVISFTGYKDGGGVCGDGLEGCFIEGGPLIGMFRIIDDEGYEYRTNAAGKEVYELFSKVSDAEEILAGRHGGSFDDLVNFELADGNTFADLVGITFWSDSMGHVNASPNVATSFGIYDEILIYTENEVPGSCSPALFSCANLTGFGGVGGMDKGIDNSLPNSKIANNRVCSTERLDANSSGWMHMPFSGFACLPPFGDASSFECVGSIEERAFFVGFVGLNNGDGTGSMDSWWTQRPTFRKKVASPLPF